MGNSRLAIQMPLDAYASGHRTDTALRLVHSAIQR